MTVNPDPWSSLAGKLAESMNSSFKEGFQSPRIKWRETKADSDTNLWPLHEHAIIRNTHTHTHSHEQYI